LVRETRADVGYTNFITKNALHEHWRTEVRTKEAYQLHYLGDFVDLRPLTTKDKEYGLGRNGTLFDIVGHWAYSAVSEHRGKTREQWLNSLLKHAQSANMMFLEPLPYSEIKATAKSIAKYCWKRDAYHYNEFIYRQALKGSKGGKVSKRKPVATSEQSLKPWL